jgi:hypothetical protein
VSYTFLRGFLLNNLNWSPRAHKNAKARIKELLLKNINQNRIKKSESELNKALILKLGSSHPMRDRKEFFDERVQSDALIHAWFGDKKSTLHGFIDDSTGCILSLCFDSQETLMGYYQCTKEMFETYGKPQEILTDKRTVFWSPKEKESDIHSDSLTQYGFMCSNEGITLTTTSITQTKGRIERLWNTLQDRLVKELAEASIATMNEANNFLPDFIKKFNERFGLFTDNIKSVFRELEEKNVDFVLSRRFERTVSNGGTIKYMNRYYMTYSKEVAVPYKKGTKIFVVETFNNLLYANTFSEWMQLVEVKQNSTWSLYQNRGHEKPAPKIVTKSPWVYTNWLMYKRTRRYVKS